MLSNCGSWWSLLVFYFMVFIIWWNGTAGWVTFPGFILVINEKGTSEWSLTLNTSNWDSFGCVCFWWRIFVKLTPNPLHLNGQCFCRPMMYYNQGNVIHIVLIELICPRILPFFPFCFLVASSLCFPFISHCWLQEIWSHSDGILAIRSLLKGTAFIVCRFFSF